MMKKFYLLFTLLLLSAGCTFVTVTPAPAAAPPAESAAGDNSTEHLLDLLRLVPNTADNRSFLTYGNIDAAYQGWDLPRIESFAELSDLDDPQRSLWISLVGRQVPVTDLFLYPADEMRESYGFDLFSGSRFLQTGKPPGQLSIIEGRFDEADIDASLSTLGYRADPFMDGSLYRINDDYEINIEWPLRMGRLGDLNRIVLRDGEIGGGQMLIAKADEVVEASAAAANGELQSLADNPGYVAALHALDAPQLADTGDLVGLVFTDEMAMADPAMILGSSAPHAAFEEMQQRINSMGSFPPYLLTGFATQRAVDATYLTLAVVFPRGTDAEAAAQTLGDRLQNYESVVTGETMNERWTFDRTFAVNTETLPSAVAVMRIDDQEPENENSAWFPRISWMDMVVQRDLLFLVPSD